MASRRKKLDVQEAAAEEKEGLKIKIEEACVYVTTVALFLGIIVILIMMGSHYGAGPFG
jgi:hypothetical protein